MSSNIVTVIVFSILLLIPVGLPYSEAQTDNTYKFDAGFYDKIAQMQSDLPVSGSSGIPDSHYYSVIIITGEKNDLVDDLQNDYNARNIFDPENLDNVITADVPIPQISRLAEIHNVVKIGDGELELEPLVDYDPRNNSHISTNQTKEYHGVTSQITQTGNRITIGIMDRYNNEAHDDLPDSDIIDRKNCYGVSCTSTFDSRHRNGTHFNHAASIITGTGASNSNMTGIAPDSKIRLTIVDDNASRVTALDYLVGRNVDLMVLSISGTTTFNCSIAYTDRDRYASIALIIDGVVRNGIPVISANGNGGTTWISSTACSYNSIGVGATNINGQIRTTSSRGPAYGAISPDISAVGTNVAGATTGTGYDIRSGTSFAAPVVTGVAALLLDKDSSLSSNEVRIHLCPQTR